MKQTAAMIEDELATLTAHLNAATARWLELASALCASGELVDDAVRFLAFRCGITTREARSYLRVGETLRGLPAIRAAFARGELAFTKVRALTQVATPASEEALLELAGALTAAQLERALRAFRRIVAEEAREAHELEYVDYHFAEDGSLYLRARLPAEEGTLVVKALEAARERVLERRREDRAASPAASVLQAVGARRASPSSSRIDPPAASSPQAVGARHASPSSCPEPFEPPRSAAVEALVELAQASLSARDGRGRERARLVVHVDATALTGLKVGRCELEDGPVLSPETTLRLGCDAETLTQIERDGLPLSVGRTRRTVPPRLRRALEARDENTCCWPGCEHRRHLDAHHRAHWAHGGETSLDNLVLLCWHHHRLVHEGGYAIEDDPAGGLRFRNRHGVLCPSVPPRSPPGSADELVAQNARLDLTIDETTNRNGQGDPLELGLAVDAIGHALAA